MEDREVLDEHMKKLGADLAWLRNSVLDVPRKSQGAEHGGGAVSKPPRRKLHVQARSESNSAYKGQRQQVLDSRTLWEVEWPAYEPIEYTHPNVACQPFWADPADAVDVDFEFRRSFEGPIICSPIGRPLNPRGRTGTSGRGLLGKWGPNHAADPIVLRRKPPPADGEPPHDATGLPGGVLFQMVAIKRKDTGDWAIPGGMVDDGENVSLTLRREFTEEAGALEDPEERRVFEAQLDKIFASGRCIYQGYVDDPRNTDNAWMETTVYVFYVDDETMARELKLLGGDDASHARWLDVDSALLNDADTLYADHRAFVQRALLQEREFLGTA